MYRVLKYVIFSIFTSALVHAQSTAGALEKTYEYPNIPQEKVFVHYNTSVVFPGEYLYYSLYCLSEKKNTTSQLSKIGYVELVNEDREVLNRQKITLVNGIGQGDYFVPADIPSGNYKLLGYTQWMRNTGLNHFFKADITVLNPYQGNQEKLIAQVNEPIDSLENVQTTGVSELNIPLKSETGYTLVSNQEKFGKRQRVRLSLKNALGAQGYGNFSLSVRNFQTQFEHKKVGSKDFLMQKKGKDITGMEVLFLPELRGALLRLKVVAENGLAVQDVNISMAIPGKNYVFKIANSNAKGIVFFNLNDSYEGDVAIFQVLGDKKNSYRLEPNDYPTVDYSDLNFNSFKISKKMGSSIVERSVLNQIENAYVDLKKDTIAEKEWNPVFDFQDAIRYNLNDYTRFKTIKETMVEIIKDVWTKKNRKGEDVFQVRWSGSDLESVVLPLLLLDGIVVEDHQLLVNYDARKINEIKVLKGTYILGEMVYDGILVFESEKPLQPDEIGLGELFQIKLLNAEEPKIYFNPRYNEEHSIKLQNIPDYRQQLLWKPQVRLNEEVLNFEFYTSDVSGTFLVALEGFSDSGRPVSISKFIHVE